MISPREAPTKKARRQPVVYREEPFVEKKYGGSSAEGGTQPEGAVYYDIRPAADSGRYQLVYCRVYSCVFAPDSGAGENLKKNMLQKSHEKAVRAVARR